MPAADTHLTPEQITAWRANATAPAELFVLGDHLANCADCRARVQEATGSDVVDALGISPDDRDAHLSYNLLEGWVDKTLTARERDMVSTHLAACDRCRSDAEGLTEFAAELRMEIRAGEEAAALVPQAAVAVPSKSLTRWWQAPTFGLAGAAAGMALAYVAVARPVQIENAALAARASENATQVQTAQAEIDKARGAAQTARSDAQTARARAAANQTLLQTAQAQEQKAARERTLAQRQAAQLARANTNLRASLAAAAAQGTPAPVQVAVAPLVAEKTFQTTVATGKLPALPARVTSAIQPDTIRGPRPAFTDLQPSATRVLSRRPTLSWRAENAQTATLVVRDVSGKEVARQTMGASQTTYTLETPLARGAIYSWRLVGADNKPVSGTVRFEVAGNEAAARYAQTLLRLAVAQTGDGLYEAARATLGQVVSLDAGNAPTRQAERLLGSLRGR